MQPERAGMTTDTGRSPSGSGCQPTASAAEEASSQSGIPNADRLITAGMLADKLRPLVLGGDHSCIDGTPFIPLHRGTVSAIYQHLERLAASDGEKTLGALEHALARHLERSEAERARLASAIEAATAGETAQTGSTEGESATAESRDAQGPSQ